MIIRPQESALPANPQIPVLLRLRKRRMYGVYNHTYHPGTTVIRSRSTGRCWKASRCGTWAWNGRWITGPDAFEFTNMLVPRDLSKCKVGRCKYVFITRRRHHQRRCCCGSMRTTLAVPSGQRRPAGPRDWPTAWAWTCRSASDVGQCRSGAKSLDVMVDLFGDSIREVPYYYAVHKEIEGMQVGPDRVHRGTGLRDLPARGQQYGVSCGT